MFAYHNDACTTLRNFSGIRNHVLSVIKMVQNVFDVHKNV
jgi:hypothetical protein